MNQTITELITQVGPLFILFARERSFYIIFRRQVGTLLLLHYWYGTGTVPYSVYVFSLPNSHILLPRDDFLIFGRRNHVYTLPYLLVPLSLSLFKD
jgi:hypothetical protein